MLLIGIDIGMQAKNTGVAMYESKEKKIIELWSSSLWHCLSAVYRPSALYGVKIGGVVLEDASLDNASFKSSGQGHRADLKLARDAGKNQGGAIVVVQMCKALDIPCLRIAPSKRRKATKNLKTVAHLKMPTKTTKAQFKALTGYDVKKGNNEHSRDAGTLVWGMTEAEFYNQIKIQEL